MGNKSQKAKKAEKAEKNKKKGNQFMGPRAQGLRKDPRKKGHGIPQEKPGKGR